MTATPTANPVELARGRRRLAAVSAAWGVLALLLVAMHSPGQMSLDSVVALYEGVDVAEAKAAVGWPLAVADTLERLPPPTEAELTALRQLKARTAEAHQRPVRLPG